MSQFLVLNFKDFSLTQDITKTIQPQTLLCICCLKKNVPLITLTNCKHSSFLDNFTLPELKQGNDVICYHCHGVLKKIEAFKQQILKSFEKLLENVNEHIDISKTKPLEKKQVVNIYLPPVKPLTTGVAFENEKQRLLELETMLSAEETQIGCIDDVTAKITNEESESVLPNVDIKNEPLEENLTVDKTIKDNIEKNLETGTPISKSKIDKYSDSSSKVKVITITKEELYKERLMDALSEKYLKFQYKCEHCIIGFNYKENIDDHMKRKHAPKEGSFLCEICLASIYPPGEKHMHIYRHYTRYECVDCKKKYSDFNDCLRHYNSEHYAQELFVCTLCNYTADTSKKLKLHEIKHTRTKIKKTTKKRRINSAQSSSCHPKKRLLKKADKAE